MNQDPGREDPPPPPDDFLEQVRTLELRQKYAEAYGFHVEAAVARIIRAKAILHRIEPTKATLYGIEPIWYPPLPEDWPEDAISTTAGYRDNPRVALVVAPPSRWERFVRFMQLACAFYGATESNDE